MAATSPVGCQVGPLVTSDFETKEQAMPLGVVALLVLMLGVGSCWLNAEAPPSADPGLSVEEGDERSNP